MIKTDWIRSCLVNYFLIIHKLTPTGSGALNHIITDKVTFTQINSLKKILEWQVVCVSG